MKPWISKFASRLEQFLEQKRALGFQYREGERILHHFDAMCHERFPTETFLTKDICLSWASRSETEGVATFQYRLAPIRDFARYLNRIGEVAYVLPVGAFARRKARYVPYIYTEDELVAIFKIFDNIKPRVGWLARHIVLPAAIRLIYYCGLRPCEARKLRPGDVDLAHGRINIIESKGYKDRIIIMADDVADYLRDYDRSISLLLPGRTAFFPNHEGQMYSIMWLRSTFIEARHVLGIKQAARIYDMRHTFATHRLYQWMRDGKDINAMLPYLSAYMGHVNLSDTFYYIHLVPGLFETMSGIKYNAFESLLPEVGYSE